MDEIILGIENEKLQKKMEKIEFDLNYSEKLQDYINKELFGTIEELKGRLDEIEDKLEGGN
jgi:hypothetical protein